MDRVRRVTFWGLCLSLLTLTSCEQLYDALVFNPCSSAATVSFSDLLPPHWHSETVVDSVGTARVHQAFTKASPNTIEYVHVLFSGGSEQVIQIVVGTENPVPVPIPVADCPPPPPQAS